MDHLDLDIANYNYEDLITLFHLPTEFERKDLKEAKKIVYRVHPDKSNLPKEYFLFFSKAFKMLVKIYEFKRGITLNASIHDEYENIEKYESNDYKALLQQQKEFEKSRTQPKEFNNWFNKLFEEANLNSSLEKGYGDWLSQKDENVMEAKNPQEMKDMIEKKKEQVRSNFLTLHKSFSPINNNTNVSLLGGEEVYSSDLFSKLQFEDLKDAHENSVIPVTHNDFLNREKFSSMEEINRSRTTDEVKSQKTFENHKDILDKEKLKNDQDDLSRFYTMLNSDEKQKEKTNEMWKKLKTLKDL
jgi:hypothetical protein